MCVFLRFYVGAVPYPSDREVLLGKLAGFAACGFLIALIVSAGNQQWGWMVLMALSALVLGWVAFILLRDD